jgi:hypothetical protein
MKFYLLHQPVSDDNFLDRMLNGTGDYKFCMPGIICPSCGPTGGIRVIPHELPLRYRRQRKFTQFCHLEIDQFARLATEVSQAIFDETGDTISLLPGDMFVPAVLNLPTLPMVDFLWNLPQVYVSERVRAALSKAPELGVVFKRVKLENVGKDTYSDQWVRPQKLQEEDDVMRHVRKLGDISKVTPYFELVITSESKTVAGPSPPPEACPYCSIVRYDLGTRQYEFKPEMWSGRHIFYLRSTLRIVISEQMKNLFELENFSNINIIEFDGSKF